MADLSSLMNLEGASTYELIANLLGVSVGAAVIILTIVSIWALVWKGLALWKSAGKKSIIWFIVLLVVNTLGILEILYIFVFSKIKLKGKKVQVKPLAKKPKKK